MPKFGKSNERARYASVFGQQQWCGGLARIMPARPRHFSRSNLKVSHKQILVIITNDIQSKHFCPLCFKSFTKGSFVDMVNHKCIDCQNITEEECYKNQLYQNMLNLNTNVLKFNLQNIYIHDDLISSNHNLKIKFIYSNSNINMREVSQLYYDCCELMSEEWSNANENQNKMNIVRYVFHSLFCLCFCVMSP